MSNYLFSTRFLFMLVLMALTAATGGCRTAVPPTTPATTFVSEVTAGPMVVTIVTTATPTAVFTPPEATATPLPAATPTATATPLPLRLGSDPSVPEIVRNTAVTIAAQNGYDWWSDEIGADLRLALNEGETIATWIYAVVAPFPTLTDEISHDELQHAWQNGLLYLDAPTAAVLRRLWGEPAQVSTIVTAVDLVNRLWADQHSYAKPVLAIVPFEQLQPRLKVIRLDGVSPIDPDFDPSAYGLTVTIGLTGAADAVAAIKGVWPEMLTNRDDGRITRVAMTGPAGMRRAVADRMERYGMNYPGEETGPILQAADIAHMSNENAFATNCPMPDPFDSDNVCNRDEYIALMVWMGINVNEMTGNHLNDWGAGALWHTFDLYDSHAIHTFGGGRDLEHARRPLLMEHNGNRIAFVGCNPVGPPYGWARENYPGALPCDDYSEIKAQISRLDAEGYLVFATLQYLEDYQYRVLDQQRREFDALAAAGATAVSGSHAHHPQGFSFAHGRFVHYGLGNLLADQMWSLGSRQMFIDTYLIYDGRLLNIDLWTGINEDYARVRQMTPSERRELLQIVFDYSFWE
jgi:hypothetical protein